jgi:sn-glycerol 3-phosphate transport system permease protein
MLVMVTVSISIALVLAVWLNKRTKLHNFVQTSIFTPHIISLVSVAMLWMWIMDPEYGLLNYILGWFGIPRLQWIDNPDTALLSVIIVGIWKVIGYNVLILIAGLQSIPSYIYESAKLDKANRVTTFFKITIPLLSPTLFFLLIVTITSSFQVFDSVRVMTQGGPVNSTNVLVHWIYQTGFEFYRIGEAATGSVLLFIIVAVATFANFKLLASKIHYQ